MTRKPGESQFSLDFNVQPKEKTEPTSVSVSNAQPVPRSPGILFDVPNQRKATPEQTEASNLQAFHNYLRNLNIRPEELSGKNILDVGASTGGFGDIAARYYGAKVISIDEMCPGNMADVLDGDSKKLFNLPAENMNLAERLNVQDEPKFDFIVSNYSTPYVFVNNEQDRRGKWKSKKTPFEWRLEMTTRIHSALENIYKHLKLGGKAILYPLFLDLEEDEQMSVDFGNDEKRDVREFNGVIHEILEDIKNEHGDNVDIEFEKVPQKDGTNFTRLIINRKNIQ